VNLFVAELRKLVTLPSLRLTALLTVTANLLLAYVYATADLPGEQVGLAPLRYTQAGFLVLGVLAAASEHQAGDQIRATLLAMPRRLRLQAAKVLALAAVTAPVAAVAALSSTLPAGETGRAPAATAYLTLTTLLAAAVGSLLRRAEAAAVLLLVAYFMAGPVLHGRFEAAAAYLPDTAVLDPSRGAAATAAWTLGAVTLAACAFSRRDA
jgi:ABC-2 type transport system permease protein